MALSYDSLQALIQKEYMPVLYDNIFVKRHPLSAILKKKAKTFNGRKFSLPLEYGEGGNVAWGAKHAEDALALHGKDRDDVREFQMWHLLLQLVSAVGNGRYAWET